ncbi:MAG: aldo/keto reductase [Ignavibacteriota bacterium]
MNYRELGRTGWKVSEISFGAWAIGGSWGSVDDGESLAALNSAIDCGVNFIDTADVYGMGRSERLIAQLKRDRKEEIVIATKAGAPALAPHCRRLQRSQHYGLHRRQPAESFHRLPRPGCNCTARRRMSTIIPSYSGVLDRLMEAGKIRHYGVSVERVEEALKAIEYPNVQTVQIIFNCFRHRPAELFFAQAKARRVGILARVPLASGMLSGKLTRDSQFAADDHRQFNRHGEAFDMGETFSGVDYQTGLDAVEELRAVLPAGVSMAQFALRWILMFDAVTCAIPGGKRPSQVRDNCAASGLPPLSDARDGNRAARLRCGDPARGSPALVARGRIAPHCSPEQQRQGRAQQLSRCGPSGRR